MAAAVAVPMLVAYSLPPTATALNQLAACAAWGAASLAAGTTARYDVRRASGSGSHLPLAALALVAIAAVSPWPDALPGGLASSAFAILSLAALCLMLGNAEARRGSSTPVGFAWGWVIAGALSAGIAIVQVAAPTWPDGMWIARSSLPGRGVGNLRQPNHLASAMVLAAIALVPLAAVGSWRRRVVYPVFAWMLLGLTLTASRTAALGVLMLALWGLIDRQLASKWRWMLALSPVLLAGFWTGMDLWAQWTAAAFAGASRLTEADVSSSRFGIWRNALELLAIHAWTGVGFGHFNLAWTLTPFPGRPTAFFDHTHNLPLHLLTELGIPLGLAVCALLTAAAWRAGRHAWRSRGDLAVFPRALFMMVLTVTVHSMLEYPLWYVHFLLPVAFALGACLAWPPTEPTAQGAASSSPAGRSPTGLWIRIAGSATLLVSTHALVDYMRVSSIFTAGPHATGLEQRLAEGRGSLYFAHHADYARATIAEHPGEVMDSIDVAKYHLLDTRLMIAWARAYAERGDLDRARYIAARLREFRNPASREFIAACEDNPRPRPFQCDPPARLLTWRDFTGKQ